jgi:hypothetical protein
MAIEDPQRFEVILPAQQKRRLAALASSMGTNSSAVVKLSIARMLADKGLVLGDAPTDPFVTFLEEMRADPRATDPAWVKMTAVLAQALEELDLEADTNPSATALTECLRLVAGAKGRIEDRILVMSQLVNTRGTVAIPRELLHPKRTKPKG